MSLARCFESLWVRALDDDPHVPVLLNPSVTRDAFERSGFPARRWTVLSPPSLLSRPWWNFRQSSSSWRWKSGKRSVLSKRSVFSTAIKRPPPAAADVDNLCRWTTRPRPCEPVCSRSRPRLCCAAPAAQAAILLRPAAEIVRLRLRRLTLCLRPSCLLRHAYLPAGGCGHRARRAVQVDTS